MNNNIFLILMKYPGKLRRLEETLQTSDLTGIQIESKPTVNLYFVTYFEERKVKEI